MASITDLLDALINNKIRAIYRTKQDVYRMKMDNIEGRVFDYLRQQCTKNEVVVP